MLIRWFIFDIFRGKRTSPLITESIAVHPVNCICGAFYFKPVDRQLFVSMRDHHPDWLSPGESSSVFNAIRVHLVGTGRRGDPTVAVRVISQVPSDVHKCARMWKLKVWRPLLLNSWSLTLVPKKRSVGALDVSCPTTEQTHAHMLHQSISGHNETQVSCISWSPYHQ